MRRLGTTTSRCGQSITSWPEHKWLVARANLLAFEPGPSAQASYSAIVLVSLESDGDPVTAGDVPVPPVSPFVSHYTTYPIPE
jgi:hypothetical protein